ncbi:hypothetical protein [Metabacillus sp. Hm71]|uniref:hypothetical protein n=1 Tax=Metabacillus sp. Hm71 TaxID=3450743 RepID=UPI003F4307FF
MPVKEIDILAKLLMFRAYNFTCSYKTAWEKWLNHPLKYKYTFEEVTERINYIYKGCGSNQ